MVFKELEERISSQLLVDRHEVGTAEVSRLSGFDGLVSSRFYRFTRALEDVVAALVDDNIIMPIKSDAPVVSGNGELAIGPELFGHYDCIHFFFLLGT